MLRGFLPRLLWGLLLCVFVCGVCYTRRFTPQAVASVPSVVIVIIVVIVFVVNVVRIRASIFRSHSAPNIRNAVVLPGRNMLLKLNAKKLSTLEQIETVKANAISVSALSMGFALRCSRVSRWITV